MNTIQRECILCGTKNSIRSTGEEGFFMGFFDCPTCGRFEYHEFFFEGKDIKPYKDKICSYLYYKSHIEKPQDPRTFFLFTKDEEYAKENLKKYPFGHWVSVSADVLNAFYPNTFAERIDRILLGYSKQSEFFGKPVRRKIEEIYSSWFINRYDKEGESLAKSQVFNQFEKLLNYFVEMKYIEASFYDNKGSIVPINVAVHTNEIGIILLAEGWKRIDSLQRIGSSNKVFIAMSFDPEMLRVRNAIKEAIQDKSLGYEAVIMDEFEHNHQIVPEMLHAIKESKFVVAELTQHNNGAYFEAGYALGLGKEVIHICNTTSFEKAGHFDVRQINTILWEKAEDIKDKLIKRIKATIPD